MDIPGEEGLSTAARGSDAPADAWTRFRKDQGSIQQMYTEYRGLLDRSESLEGKLEKAAKSQNKAVTALRSELGMGVEKLSQISTDISFNQEVLNTLPRPGDYFVRLFFGSSLSFIFKSKKRKLAFKEEYELFKQQLNFVAIAFSVLLYCVCSRALDTIFQLFAVYYYCALILRELILRANGSDLKPWWIRHHYISLFVAVVLLTWPETPVYMSFRDQFYAYVFGLGLVQLLQTRYQLARLYPRKVVGKGDQMETVWGELPLFFSRRGLAMLVPCLLAMYGFQYYNAYVLIPEALNGAEWQAWALSLAFVVASTGNLVTLCIILVHKFLSRRKARTDSKSSKT